MSFKNGAGFIFSLFFFFWGFFSYGAPSDTSAIKDLLTQSLHLQRSNPEEAYKLATNAYTQSQKIDFKKGMGTAFMRMGSILYAKGQNDSALLYLNQAQQIRKNLLDYKGASGACIVLSYVYNTLGVKDSAFASLYDALHLNKLSNDSADLADSYISLGNLYIEYGNVKEGQNAYLLAEKIARKINNPQELSLALGGLGNFYFNQKQFHKALDYFIQKLQLDETLEDPMNRAQALNNIGLCYEQLKEYFKASIYYHRAIAQYQELDMRNDEGIVCFNLGSLFNNQNNPDSALFFLNKSLQIAREVADLNRVASSYEFLSDAFALKGNYLLAYQYHQKYTEVKDSLINQEKIKSISEMQTKYGTEKKAQEIILLDEQNKTKLAQRNFFIAGSIVLFLGLLFLGFYYIQKNKLAKQNEFIAGQKIESLLNEQEIKSYNAMIEGQEEERKRISIDLHDRLGSMLSTVKLLFSSLDSKITQNHQENNTQFNQVNDLLDEACVEVRRISHNLNTGMVMHFGLQTALQELCNSIDFSGLIKCKLLAYGMDERLEIQAEIEIYRMIQELVNNILKHAKAKSIIIQLIKMEDALSITVEDDGVGFDVEEKMQNGGMGLQNVHHRAKKLSGQYHMDSKLGKGTLAVIEIPLQHD